MFPGRECLYTCWLTNLCRTGQKCELLCQPMPVPAGVTNSNFFPDVTVVVAILHVMSSIDFTNKQII